MIFLKLKKNSILKSIIRKYRKLIQIIRLNNRFSCYITDDVDLHIQHVEDITFGKGVYIGAFSSIHVVSQKGKRNSKLIIGEGTSIGEFNNIRAGGGVINIGKECLISQFVTIVAANHEIKKGEYIKYQNWTTKNNFVTIGDDVWVGANVVILPGVTIGDGAVIGASSVVTKDVPENSIAFGAPCQVVDLRK